MVKKPNNYKIGLVAMMLVVIAATLPLFINLGEPSYQLMGFILMLCLGFMGTWVYSEHKLAGGGTSVAMAGQMMVVMSGLMGGFLIVILNVGVGRGANLLLGSIDPTLLYLVMLAGVAEELFFRGFLQSYFRSVFSPLKSRWTVTGISVFLSASVFMLYHFYAYQGTTPMLVMFAIGCGFGVLYDLTKDIGAPMVAHVLNNTFASMAILMVMLQQNMAFISLFILLIGISFIFMRTRGKR